MSDAIPNEEYSKVCRKCEHHNLRGRLHCFGCGNRLDPQPVENIEARVEAARLTSESYPLALANAIRYATQIRPRGTVEDMADENSPLYDPRLFDFYMEAGERLTQHLHRSGWDNDTAIVKLTQLQEQINGQILQFQADGFAEDSVMIQMLRGFL